jgi:hypothetical protein
MMKFAFENLVPRMMQQSLELRDAGAKTVKTRILHWRSAEFDDATQNCRRDSLLRCIRKAQFCTPEKECESGLDDISADRFISSENSECKIRVLTV